MTQQLRRTTITAARTAAAWTVRLGSSFIRCSGSDRIDFLHRMTTNDLTKLLPDHGMQTVIVNEKARILDVVMVLQASDEAFLLGSSGTSTMITSWLRKYVITDDVRFTDQTDQCSCIEIMGPRSADVVQGLLEIDVRRWSLGQWALSEVGERPVRVVRMPSSCELSYWILTDNETMGMVTSALRNSKDDIPELTAHEAQYLRVLSGMGAYDHEWSAAYNPLEAGLLHLTSFTKGCYIGQEVIARLDSYNKVKQRIMGVVASSPMAEGDVVCVDDTPVGVITTVSPSCDGAWWLALGYLRGEHAVDNTPVTVQSSGSVITALLHLPPLKDPSWL